MKNIIDYINESLIVEAKGDMMFTLDNWVHISMGMYLDEMEDDDIKSADKDFHAFFNKSIKGDLVKVCKADNVDIKVTYKAGKGCVIDGVTTDNVAVFFKHFYNIMSDKYELYTDDIYSLFGDSDIDEDIVYELIEEYGIE
jgi:hypothetical protein